MSLKRRVRGSRQRRRWWGGRAESSRMDAEAAPGQGGVCRTSSLSWCLVYSRETPHTCGSRAYVEIWGDIELYRDRLSNGDGWWCSAVPGDTLDELLLILVQTHSERCPFLPAGHLHPVHLGLWYRDVLQTEEDEESVAEHDVQSSQSVCKTNPSPGCSIF